MEVTKSNLKALLPVLQDVLEKAHFIAIDTEFTGLSSENNDHAFDTLEERYHKLKQGCGKFLVIQFGLSAFSYHPDQKKYTHADFNFYIFPRPYSRQAPDLCFLCQSSSLDYLVQHGFDFNKLLHEGIPYLTPCQEQKMQELLTEKHKDQLESLTPCKTGNQKSKDQRPMVVPEEQKGFIQNIHNLINSLMKNETEKVLKLPACNSFQRKLIYQTVNSKYPSGLDLSSSLNENKQMYITVVKATEEERRNLLHVRQIADLEELDEAVGFRKVLELITQSGKLVVGHNMLLDMMHVINQFYYPLPESLDDFKELLCCNFPHVLDTKTMSSLPPFKDYFTSTGLGPLLNQLQDRAFGLPMFEPAEEFKGYELSDNKEHEAGYDAFITGLCFTGLMKRLAYNIMSSGEFVPSNSKHLRPFINKIFIMRHYDITSLNLNGPDPEPSREHVFHVTFPREWRTVDLVELFLPYGQIYVSWLSESSALVGLKNPKYKNNVIKALVQTENSFYKVRPYSEYVETQKKLRSPLAQEDRTSSALQVDSVFSSKRRRSSGGSGSENLIKRTIDPIIEDEEEIDLSNSCSSSKGSNSSGKKSPSVEPNISSEPDLKRKKTCMEESSSKLPQHQKVFAEPDTW